MADLNIVIKDFPCATWFLRSIDKILKIEKIKSHEVSIVICSDSLIKKLNKNYRKKDKTTDVLSFAEIDIKNNKQIRGQKYLGEIFINYKQAKRQATNTKQELINLFVHGYLHLRGYLHDTDKQEKAMETRAKKLISRAKIKF